MNEEFTIDEVGRVSHCDMPVRFVKEGVTSSVVLCGKCGGTFLYQKFAIGE